MPEARLAVARMADSNASMAPPTASAIPEPRPEGGPRGLRTCSSPGVFSLSGKGSSASSSRPRSWPLSPPPVSRGAMSPSEQNSADSSTPSFSTESVLCRFLFGIVSLSDAHFAAPETGRAAHTSLVVFPFTLRFAQSSRYFESAETSASLSSSRSLGKHSSVTLSFAAAHPFLNRFSRPASRGWTTSLLRGISFCASKFSPRLSLQ
mmetsp:Transcript_28857/g.68950  ORF Transcript_28857/g.68950 Transcript_28857/m.68950 type:complete len:207 (-) Transcript_28857:222-842(-)